MKKNHIIISLSMLFMITTMITSCKSSKTATESDYDKSSTQYTNVLNELIDTYQPWETFSTSGKLSISGVISFSTSMQLKMVQNKCITISIRPVLGIEAAKVFIDNDSAVVINKLNKVYTSIKLKDLEHILPVNIGVLQDMLLARAFTLDDGTLSKKSRKKFAITESTMKDTFVLSPIKQNKNFSYEFVINKDKQMTALNVYPSKSSKIYTAQYSDFVTDKYNSIAGEINIETNIKKENISLRLSMNSSKIKWNETIDESFSIGKSYRKVSVLEFLSMLKSF